MGRLDERGITLLELLVAMTLLVIALVGLAATFPLAMFGITTGGYQTTATLLAQQGIEQAKAVNYAALATWTGPDGTVGSFVVPVADPNVSPPLTFAGFLRRTTVGVGLAGGAPSDTTAVISVTVRFVGGGGENIDTTVATVLAE